MAIDVNETVRVKAYLEREDPVTGNKVPEPLATNRVVTVYRPNGTVLDTGSGSEVENLGGGYYSFLCVPDVGGLHEALFTAMDPANKPIAETTMFYVHG